MAIFRCYMFFYVLSLVRMGQALAAMSLGDQDLFRISISYASVWDYLKFDLPIMMEFRSFDTGNWRNSVSSSIYPIVETCRACLWRKNRHIKLGF